MIVISKDFHINEDPSSHRIYLTPSPAANDMISAQTELVYLDKIVSKIILIFFLKVGSNHCPSESFWLVGTHFQL